MFILLSLRSVLKVNFLCRPYRPCERGGRAKVGEDGEIGGAAFDPSQACNQGSYGNATEPAGSDSGRGGGDPEQSWFMCETDMDMAELHSNSSSSGIAHFEVSVELQLTDAETLNLTLYGRSNQSSLHLHPPEEEEEVEEAEEEEKKGDEEQTKAFYCCFPATPTPQAANQSRCLLWLANQTVLTATAKLPWKRAQKGWCQDERAGLLCSPCGQRGFALRLERRGGERRGDSNRRRNWPISFHFR